MQKICKQISICLELSVGPNCDLSTFCILIIYTACYFLPIVFRSRFCIIVVFWPSTDVLDIFCQILIIVGGKLIFLFVDFCLGFSPGVTPRNKYTRFPFGSVTILWVVSVLKLLLLVRSIYFRIRNVCCHLNLLKRQGFLGV